MKIASDYITENNGKFTVHSHTGKSMGSYPTCAEADKRLKQIEYFKHAKDALDASQAAISQRIAEEISKGHKPDQAAAIAYSELGEDMSPGEMDALRKLFDRFLKEEEGEPAHQIGDGANKVGAGVIFQTPTGRVLLLRRAADEKNYGGHWGLPGGKAEDGETPEQAARREVAEETGISIPATVSLKPVNKVNTPNGFEFYTFLCAYPEEFAPVLADGEHDDHQWASLDNLPAPIHPGVKETLQKLAVLKPGAADALALDKDSVRMIDDVGRMHVDHAHISKAAVNPYYGREIPNWQELGLDPDRIYQMLRDPAELEKAAKSFEGIQVLIRHIPVSADDHRPDEIVGTTGTSAEFNAPYLDNELVIWAKAGIDVVESEEQRELSCGYGYTPVMEPGTFEGVPYDGRMTNIKGNHVALVSKGRAGPDVVIGDAAIQPKEVQMNKPLSRTAALLQAALSAHFMPKIALDAQLKVSTALSTGLTQLGQSEKITRAALKKPNLRAAIVKMAKDAAEPHMTPEAKKSGGFGPDDVTMRVLDMVEGQAAGAGEAEEEEEHDAELDQWRKSIMDACMKAGMDEKSAGAICDMFPGAKKAQDEEEDDEEETAEEKAAKEKAEKEKADKDKKAMDETIKTAVTTAVEAERKRSKDASEARQFVEPWVGKVSLAHDSAEDIYRAALGMLGVKHEAVKDPAALKILVEAQRKPHERRETLITTDAAPEGKAFADMFPGAERIGHAA